MLPLFQALCLLVKLTYYVLPSYKDSIMAVLDSNPVINYHSKTRFEIVLAQGFFFEGFSAVPYKTSYNS